VSHDNLQLPISQLDDPAANAPRLTGLSRKMDACIVSPSWRPVKLIADKG
jgi:hypothetical protein